MNNIEILEELIENYKCAYPEEESWCAIYPLQMKAIENLIKENKELREKDIHITKETVEFVNSHYIHKSKVKEKIEELDKKMAEDEVDEFGIHSQGWAALDWTRDFLLELLEKGE